MKLYYAPGACSLSPHIVANEAGIPLELVKVDVKTKTIAREGDFWDVNPKGYVPALELDDGEVLTEGPAIVQYLADRVPDAGLAPAERLVRARAPAGGPQLPHLRDPQVLLAVVLGPTCFRRCARNGSPISGSATR